MDDTRQLLDLGIRAAGAYERPDLLRRLQSRRAAVARREVRVVVLGEAKQGKSELVNGLLGRSVCPVDDDIATSVPTTIRFGPSPATLATRGGEGHPAAERIDSGQLARIVRGSDPDVRAVEVQSPEPLLAQGLVVIDSPPAGPETLALLPFSHGALLATDASHELTGPELELLAAAAANCPKVACVLTKIDIYGEWRRILELDRRHLAEAGLDVPVLATSAALLRYGVDSGDPDAYAESGYAELLRWVNELLAHSVDGSNGLALRELDDALAQLEAAFTAEQQALADPNAAAQRWSAQAARLRNTVGTWQSMLQEGCSDLASEVDHDLKARLRELGRMAEERLEAGDPADDWSEFSAWLSREVMAEVTNSYLLLTRAATELARRIDERLAGATSHLGLEPASSTGALAPVSMSSGGPRAESWTEVGLHALRNSYSGVLMFGFISQLLGMGLLNPVGLLLGAAVGGRAVREERKRQLAARQQQAKATVRRYLDDVVFHAGKDLRDEVQRVRRELRSAYTQRAEELHESAARAVAQAAQGTARPDGERRQRDVEAELRRIRALRARVRRLCEGLA